MLVSACLPERFSCVISIVPPRNGLHSMGFNITRSCHIFRHIFLKKLLITSKQFFQILLKYLRHVAVSLYTGMQAAANSIRCRIWKVQKADPGIGSVRGITLHRFADHRQEAVSQHSVAPDDLCCGIAVAYHFQEIANGCGQYLFYFFYVPGSCPFLSQFRCRLNSC